MRTSLRPAEIAGRASSWRKDDTLLHVDAFPSQPTNGNRILRVFCNVNPAGKPRVWRLGESFETVARRFITRIGRPFPGSARLLSLLGVTKSARSEYDYTMLKLHDAMKSDAEYQSTVGQTPVLFRPGTTWICYADSVSHAALSGQHQFEQTIFVPLDAMLDVNKSPLRILERLRGRALA
jgi:3-deoxy-D-manno-oct-2-ulosonic acid (Kdo) hydroxylase